MAIRITIASLSASEPGSEGAIHTFLSDIDSILKYFHPNLGQSDTLMGGQFFAALRLVIHAEGGDGVDCGLAFVQGGQSSSSASPFTLVPIVSSSSNPTTHPQKVIHNPFLLRAKGKDREKLPGPNIMPPLPPRKPPLIPPPCHVSLINPLLPAPIPSRSTITPSPNTNAAQTPPVIPSPLVPSTNISGGAASQAAQMKKAEEQLEKERVMRVLKKVLICRSYMEHRHSYIRKNAVFAVYAIIYREFENLILNAPELLQTFLAAESDVTCKGNISTLVELLQMSVIDVIRLDCKNDTANWARYSRCIFELLHASSHAVKYESATTLTTLTQNLAVVKGGCRILFHIKESDNNVKLIVLDCLDTLRSKHGDILDMNVLQVLSNPYTEVRQKAMSVALSMTFSQNVDEVARNSCRRRNKRIMTRYHFSVSEYRQLPIQSIHVTLMEFLGDSNNPSAPDVVAFVRQVLHLMTFHPFITDLPCLVNSEIVEKFPHLRQTICEYVESVSDIRSTLQEIRKVLGKIPILASEKWLLDEANGGEEPDGDASGKKDEKPKEGGGRGTTTARLEVVKAAAKLPLRTLILGGVFFMGAVLDTALAKLVLRFDELTSDSIATIQVPIDENSHECILNCIQTLSELEATPAVHDIFLKDTKAVHTKMLGAQEWRNGRMQKAQAVIVQVDDLLTFREFSQKSADDAIDFDENVGKVTGNTEIREDFISYLSCILWLASFSDLIYAAYVKIHGFNIMLGEPSEGDTRYDLTFADVLLVNQTPNMLQNLYLDFPTLGNLKLVERPRVYTIAPHGFQSIKVTINVRSFPNRLFQTLISPGRSLRQKQVSSLAVFYGKNLPYIDMDYIKSPYYNEAHFRSKWTDFEWENRVNVTTSVS
ncbi:hypothetical protein PILCRDRAFT_16427 [Piloderma croceum F 1598]|uniref:Clathrin/coatomer adaptor adaptin-like N-terminal domain-containing protein n=1 Tax=Piloderma croceum (strain F 1598) TaxID=765440 RepID=A0A0C3AEE1_PILCF|nr:hypothetical protein PILCRDRAFT_16427 [Piloderma croceum F 1598]